MKRIILFATVLLLFGTSVAFAQQFEDESELYPKTFPIARIYSHSRGYRIDYIRQDYTYATLWAPIEWFRSASNTGSMAYGKSAVYPYITFFYKNGEVDYLRIYAVEDLAHESWGFLDPNTDYSEEFPSPDSKPVVIY